jgi:processive 1,2-diacylglycerol beta-glucosyltransferase
LATFRTVILHAKSGALGHAVSAHAYAELLRDHGHEVSIVDAMECDRGSRDVHGANALYFELLNRAPVIWRALYAGNPFIPGLTWAKSEWLPRRFPRTCDQLASTNPSLVISTHPIATAIASFLIKKGKSHFTHLAVFVDWHFQPFWLFSYVHGYLVVSEIQVREMLRRRVPSDAIVKTGLLVHKRFYRSPNRASCRRAVGIADREKTILVMSGGTGWRVDDFVKTACRLESTKVFAVGVADHVRSRIEALAKTIAPASTRVEILGHETNRRCTRACPIQ